MRVLRSLLVVAAALAVAVPLLLHALLPHFLYFPRPGGGPGPGVEGVDYHAVTLVAEDGVALSAWWVEGVDPTRAVLWLHGNAGNLSHRAFRLERFREAGLSVLALDYRGYGSSEGSPSAAGLARDARAAWRWLVDERGLAPERVALLGSSLGAAVALQLALEVEQEARLGLVALEAPFLSVRAMAREVAPLVPAVAVPEPYDNAAAVARLRAPLVVYHGDADPVIPFEQGRALLERGASAQKLFVPVRGGRHLCLESPTSDAFTHFCAAAASLSIPPLTGAE